ncbi:MAG: cupin domain-containing protein [Anaerolineales bacterium]
MNEKQADLSGGAQDLAAMIALQPNAVVSRTLVNKPAGTVTLFAFDAGEGLSEHTAPYDALVHVVEGEASVRIGTQEHAVAAGQVLLLPANQPHALKATTPFKMLLTMVRA